MTDTSTVTEAAVETEDVVDDVPNPSRKLTLNVGAAHFAQAWVAVTRACSDDQTRPTLTNVLVEVISDTAVRLVATDSYSLYTAVVGVGAAIEDYDTPPLWSVQIDPFPELSWRFCKRLRKMAYSELTSIVIDASGLTIRFEGKSLLCPSGYSDIEFPDWRRLVKKASDRKAGHDGMVCLSGRTLGLLAKVADEAWEDEHRPTRINIGGHLDPVYFRSGDVTGIIMPVRP